MKELDVISIIDMSGLEKTTLACKIYQSQTIEYEFHTRIWVNFCLELNRNDIFLNILKEFTTNQGCVSEHSWKLEAGEWFSNILEASEGFSLWISIWKPSSAKLFPTKSQKVDGAWWKTFTFKQITLFESLARGNSFLSFAHENIFLINGWWWD